MTTLLIYAGPGDAAGAGTRTGGVPLVPPGFTWPHCDSCAAPMLFTAQIRTTAEATIALFLCRHNARAFRFATYRVAPAAAPGAVLSDVSAIRMVEVASSYEEACDAWPRRRDVLGQLGGSPAWSSHDETPTCAECGETMDFLAQLETNLEPRLQTHVGTRLDTGRETSLETNPDTNLATRRQTNPETNLEPDLETHGNTGRAYIFACPHCPETACRYQR
ncbi:DUF1963 domain-containing protein [Amycolatopsis acidicola]|uniref:DUF1963 domain-containing protein n=1 Tax=Amycolatopsis acidicola TaxID=2596893 RepID=A0A5N0V1J9_9PSEU|nr:DUF1963 domain-containing protein [Amycolatopsis acidicola]